jgi:hypothetical protein
VVVFLAPAGRHLLLAYVAPDGASMNYYIVTINISPLRGWRHKIRERQQFLVLVGRSRSATKN